MWGILNREGKESEKMAAHIMPAICKERTIMGKCSLNASPPNLKHADNGEDREMDRSLFGPGCLINEH